MKRATSLVLALLMLMSIVASLNPIELNEREQVDDTNGRADYEVWLMGANSPRESTIDISGNVRNSVDAGEPILFDLVILNDGLNDISELTVTVTVDTVEGIIPLFINAEDAAVCDDTLACGIQTFVAGDYLANGHYIVRDSTGADLVWTPTVPGMYTIHIEIDALDQDTNLNNNILDYDVQVVDWFDISTELAWDSGNDPASGAGPHAFTMTAFVNGSADWDPRDVQMEVAFGGLFKAYADPMNLGNWEARAQFDADNDGIMDDCDTNGVEPANVTSCTWDVTFGKLFGAGQAEDIEVFADMSSEPPTYTMAGDIGETRQVADYQNTSYTFAGVIEGDAESANGEGTFTVQSSLSKYSIYEMVTRDDGSGSHPPVLISEMKEIDLTLDDRNENNDAFLTATFASYHDARVLSVRAGDLHQESGRLDAGMTRLFATVGHSGSDLSINVDWEATFTVKDSNGMIIGESITVNECDNQDDPAGSQQHGPLGEQVPGTVEAIACTELMINPGMISVSATVLLIDTTLTDGNPATDCGTGSNRDCHVDMNLANDMRIGHFEVLNTGPSAYLTMDEVEGDIVSGTHITFSARAEHLGQPDFDNDGNPDPFGYTWSMSGSELDPQLDVCSGMEDPMTGAIMGGSASCPIDISPLWLGTKTMIVTVTDFWGATASAQITFNTWNDYSNESSGDCWTASYDILYAGVNPFSIGFSDADDVTDQTLSGSPGWDSVCTFNIDVPEVKAPEDVRSENLVVSIDADPSVGHSLWYEGTLENWVELEGVTQTQVDADTINLSWSNNGLPSRSSSLFAVFASATLGQPPQIGIDSLTATLGSAGVIDLSWAINNSQLTGANDYGVLYVNDDGAALDGTRSTFELTTTTHTISGTHGTTYEFLVRVENGEVGTDGATLYGTPVDSGSATADGQVDPTAGATGLDATSSGESSIHFTWTSADSSDVNHWLICWSPAQHTSLEVTSLITANNCHTTADSSMDVTMNRHSGSGVFYYSVAAVDSVGNMETADSTAGLRFTDDTGPGVNVDDTIGVEGGDGEIPTQAWIAIGILVLVAVIAGAFILTRGGEGEGDSDEFDY